MTAKPAKSENAWVDPDDAPAWSNEMFERAELADNGTVLRSASGTVRSRGRPRVDAPKRQISVRLDQDVLAGLKNLGPGWQGRMNDALREWLATHR